MLSLMNPTDYQNPFRLARLTSSLRTLRASLEALHTVCHDMREVFPDTNPIFSTPEQIRTAERLIERAILGAEATLGAEQAKPRAVRILRQRSRGEDDAWRVVVVLTREVSDTLPARFTPADDCEGSQYEPETAFERACADLWCAWGMDASASPLEDYSPTGRMYQRSLSARRAPNGCVILSQSGARDV